MIRSYLIHLFVSLLLPVSNYNQEMAEIGNLHLVERLYTEKEADNYLLNH